MYHPSRKSIKDIPAAPEFDYSKVPKESLELNKNNSSEAPQFDYSKLPKEFLNTKENDLSEAPEFDYSNFKMEEESPLNYAGRNLARTGARVAETTVGAPGDIANAIYGLGKKGYEYSTGNETGLPEEIPYLPTSQSLRNQGKELSRNLGHENYLEPHTENEAFADEITSDLTSFLLGGKNVKSAAKIALAINAAGEGVKRLGFGDEGKAIVKGGLLGAHALKDMPKLTSGSLKTIKNWMSKPIPGANKVSTGSVLWNNLTKGSLFAENYVANLSKEIAQDLENVGKSTPAIMKKIKEVNTIKEGIKTSNIVSNIIKENVLPLSPLKSPLSYYAFGLNVPKHLLSKVAGIGAVNILETFKHPSIAKYFIKSLGYSIAGNIPLATRSILKVDEQMDKYSNY